MQVHLPYQLVLSPLEAGHTSHIRARLQYQPALDGASVPTALEAGVPVHLLQLHA